MFFYRNREKVKCVVCLIVAIIFSAFFWLVGLFALPASSRSREYYLYDASSQAQIQAELSLSELPFVQGESAEYEPQDIEEFICSLLKSCRAEVLFMEEVGGVRSYYCYSPRLGAGKILKGYSVNLHIACKDTRVKVGTPVIFGGY